MWKHRSRHFDLQAGAASVWRSMLEDRAKAESADFERGVRNLVTPRAYLEVMVAKAFAGLATDGAEIGPDLGLRAAAELNKLAGDDDEQRRWAEVHAKQSRIIEVMRSLPGEYQQMVLAKLDGKPWPPPSGGARLALVEGSVTDDEEFDPFDADEDFDDED